MSFRNRIKFHLVKILGVSYKEAEALLFDKKVFVNAQLVTENIIVAKEDELKVAGEIVRAKKQYTYIALYKPVGVETTLNESISNNLNSILNIKNVFPVGRLDKASEGLLLLTDNGKIFDKILRSNHTQEKEYIVTINEIITQEFMEALQTGIVIMGKKTLPTQVKIISDTTFNITLTEGRNRQIRRMCYKFGYEVERLIRMRIINIHLNNLQPGQYRNLSEEEVKSLMSEVL